ncbi:uncharacterized protein LOC123314060 [Coccinella septempunctata]|uniref:uncharacterized protein LOC123314058 n=1 Tax=Coccinella septempunctata TaxID=41139 RepID=UPI001D06BD59|nr:uncharacterized protein LOC123314058 [Coccinella septempunctata]XP_044755107.1 uncharacterized protein LOC123314060 [Coccinella septempunctata]
MTQIGVEIVMNNKMDKKTILRTGLKKLKNTRNKKKNLKRIVEIRNFMRALIGERKRKTPCVDVKESMTIPYIKEDRKCTISKNDIIVRKNSGICDTVTEKYVEYKKPKENLELKLFKIYDFEKKTHQFRE